MSISYQHRWQNGDVLSLAPSKVVCVGSNYSEHILEMNSETPTEPVLFIKPTTSLCEFEQAVRLPTNLKPGSHECHHELELAVLIGSTLSKATSENEADNAILGYGLALDLTLRQVQSGLKQKGRPWEISKGFDNACPVSAFVAKDSITKPQSLPLSLEVNGEIRQQGNTSQMLNKILPLLVYMSQHFTLLPGDLVLTGTPSGVGPLYEGDTVCARLDDKLSIQTVVTTL